MSEKNGSEANVVVTESNEADYNTEIGTILAYPADKLETITIPVIKLIDESETLHCSAVIDRLLLEKAGLEPGAVDRLQSLAGALRLADAKLKKTVEYENEWRKESPAAFTLYDLLVHHYNFAYVDDPKKLQKVHRMSKGKSADNMVQNLQNLCSFGLSNTEELERIGFDMALLEQAAEMSARMGTLHGIYNTEKKNITEVHLIRNKAYSCLKRQVALVRKYGKYVFYRDAEKRSAYCSSYSRTRNRARKNVEPLNVEEKTEDSMAA